MQDRNVGHPWNAAIQQGNIPSESIYSTLKLLPTRLLLRHNGGVDTGVGTVNLLAGDEETDSDNVPYK